MVHDDFENGAFSAEAFERNNRNNNNGNAQSSGSGANGDSAANDAVSVTSAPSVLRSVSASMRTHALRDVDPNFDAAYTSHMRAVSSAAAAAAAAGGGGDWKGQGAL